MPHHSVTVGCFALTVQATVNFIGAIATDSVSSTHLRQAFSKTSTITAGTASTSTGMVVIPSSTSTSAWPATSTPRPLPFSNCTFADEPTIPWAWDPSCNVEGVVLGCKADGIHQECRFCGAGTYAACPACAFPAPPETRYVWDNSCRPGSYVKGCYADGIHFECRFCGQGDLDPCPGDSTTMTSNPTTTTTYSKPSSTLAQDMPSTTSSQASDLPGTTITTTTILITTITTPVFPTTPVSSAPSASMTPRVLCLLAVAIALYRMPAAGEYHLV